MGLGTTLCKRIIAALNGSIECISSPLQGTTFKFWIPIRTQLNNENIMSSNVLTMEEEEYVISKEYTYFNQLFKTKICLDSLKYMSNILIVDDDSFNIFSLKLLL